MNWGKWCSRIVKLDSAELNTFKSYWRHNALPTLSNFSTKFTHTVAQGCMWKITGSGRYVTPVILRAIAWWWSKCKVRPKVRPGPARWNVMADRHFGPKTFRHQDSTALLHWYQSTLKMQWLPITQHVTFKIALMTFDCHHGWFPKYLRDVCTLVTTAVCWSRRPCRPPRNDNSLRQLQLSHCQTLNLERSSRTFVVRASGRSLNVG